MDFKDMTVGEFARGIGAELPVAGGGSAAALSGALWSRSCINGFQKNHFE